MAGGEIYLAFFLMDDMRKPQLKNLYCANAAKINFSKRPTQVVYTLYEDQQQKISTARRLV